MEQKEYDLPRQRYRGGSVEVSVPTVAEDEGDDDLDDELHEEVHEAIGLCAAFER